MKTLHRLNPLISQTWRDIRRERSPTTTANTWRQEEHKTLSSGWRTQRGTGECTLLFIVLFSKMWPVLKPTVFFIWLSSFCRSLFRRHADGTYTSDVSSYLQDQAAKEFVSWLKTGRGRREWCEPERPSRLPEPRNNLHRPHAVICSSLYYPSFSCNQAFSCRICCQNAEKNHKNPTACLTLLFFFPSHVTTLKVI